jgi:hypothetical protein
MNYWSWSYIVLRGRTSYIYLGITCEIKFTSRQLQTWRWCEILRLCPSDSTQTKLVEPIYVIISFKEKDNNSKKIRLIMKMKISCNIFTMGNNKCLTA